MGEFLTKWKEKLSDKGRSRWLILLLVGLLFIVITLPVSSDSDSKETSADFSWGDSTLNSGKDSAEETAEKTLLEQKLGEILESVEGVGKVRVMIMTGEENDGLLYASSSEKVTGVLISAEGADNYVVVKNIQDAVMALFQVDAHKIKVMKMK